MKYSIYLVRYSSNRQVQPTVFTNSHLLSTTHTHANIQMATLSRRKKVAPSRKRTLFGLMTQTCPSRMANESARPLLPTKRLPLAAERRPHLRPAGQRARLVAGTSCTAAAIATDLMKDTHEHSLDHQLFFCCRLRFHICQPTKQIHFNLTTTDLTTLSSKYQQTQTD